MEEKKNSKKYKYYGLALYYFIVILKKTFRFIRIPNDNVDEMHQNYILCFWHQKLLNSSLSMQHIPKKVGLASPSKDGELIAIPLEKLGFDIIRGSSNKKSISSLLTLLKFLKKGYTIGTPVDGPKGPPQKVKLGFLYLAQKSGVKIVPMGGAYSKKWTLSKTWDQFQIPKPFSKIVYALGDPMTVDETTNLEEFAIVLEKEINILNKKAECFLREENI